ncbi:MAG: BrnT family toxin [Ignavibacteriae bacterium]|nr:BrnT family toxin [Ignavibacteriota bacterium]
MDISKIEGFEWDSGNLFKNEVSHNVKFFEVEEIFLNEPLIIKEDLRHSVIEDRYYALGTTNISRKLFVVFTFRKNLIRVISARDMSKKERILYEEKENSGI